MPTPPSAGLDVGMLLDRVGGRAPIEAVDAAAETLAERLGARALAFLIPQFSGPARARGEAIGVLELPRPGRPPPALTAVVAAAAHALAYVVIAARRYTDVF